MVPAEDFSNPQLTENPMRHSSTLVNIGCLHLDEAVPSANDNDPPPLDC